MKDRINNGWNVFSNTNDWIKVSDNKAFGLIASQGVFFAFIFSQLGSKEFYKSSDLTCLIILMLAVILNFASISFAFIAANPKLKIKGGVSPIYFGSIANNFKDSKEYSDFCSDKLDTDEKVSYELEGQIYVNSRIAWNKFKNVTISIRFFFASIAVWLLYILLQTSLKMVSEQGT